MTLLRMLSFTPVAQKKTPEDLNQIASREEREEHSEKVTTNLELDNDDAKSFSEQEADESEAISIDSLAEESLPEEETHLAEQQADILSQAESLRDQAFSSAPSDRDSESIEPFQEAEDSSNFLMDSASDEQLPAKEHENLAQDSDSHLSTTESLIAMKQQIKALNKQDIENHSLESGKVESKEV